MVNNPSTREGIGYPLQYSWASLVAQLVKNLPASRETWVWSLGWEDPLEKGEAIQSSILTLRSPWKSSWGYKELDTTKRLSRFFSYIVFETHSGILLFPFSCALSFCHNFYFYIFLNIIIIINFTLNNQLSFKEIGKLRKAFFFTILIWCHFSSFWSISFNIPAVQVCWWWFIWVLYTWIYQIHIISDIYYIYIYFIYLKFFISILKDIPIGIE